jgi:hypothetical protein
MSRMTEAAWFLDGSQVLCHGMIACLLESGRGGCGSARRGIAQREWVKVHSSEVQRVRRRAYAWPRTWSRLRLLHASSAEDSAATMKYPPGRKQTMR